MMLRSSLTFPSNFYIIAPLFFQAHGEILKKICGIVPEISIFSLFSCTHFPPGKGGLSCAATPLASHIFCVDSKYPYHNLYNIFCKCLVGLIWEIGCPFCFQHYLEKVENWAKFLKTKTMNIGQAATTFGSLGFFFIVTYCSQRDLTLGVFLEILALKKFVFL